MLKGLNEVKLSKNEQKLLENGWGFNVAYKINTFKFFYKSDNEKVEAYLSLPKEINAKLPVIIWNRGGNDKSGLIDDFLACGILGEIASWGYVVFASQYRKNDEFGGSDVNDVLDLIEIAKEFEYSDKNRIGMEGWSRGGMMSYLALTKTSEVKCCIIVAGLSNLKRNRSLNNKLAKVFNNILGSDNETDFVKKLEERSAVNLAEKINKNTNILFIHGTADMQISYQDSVEMYNKLTEINNKTDYHIKLVDKGDHYLRKERKSLSEVRKQWFEKYLK